MSENEKKLENNEDVPIINNEKTNNIINSINSTIIPNVKEISNASTNEENYNNYINKNENNNNNPDEIQKTNFNNNYNKINFQYIPNNNNIHNNNNPNNINVNNNQNNINLNNNINNNINEEEFNNINNNINKESNIDNNLYTNPNTNKNMYINSNINNNVNQNNTSSNQIKSKNNFSENFHPPNKNRKKNNVERKSGQKGMKELAFMFPLKESFSKVEIPFSFQQNLDESNNNSHFHTYITIKDIPKLHIDISDETKMGKFELSSNIESLKSTSFEIKKNLERVDENNLNYDNENETLRKEIEKITNEINAKNNEINNLELAIKQINQNNNKYEEEIKEKIKKKNNSYKQLEEEYNNIKNDIKNKNLDDKQEKSIYLAKIHEEINKIQKEYQNNFKYYTNKLMDNNNYTDEYIKKSLQKDLLDFTSYVTQKIQMISPKVNELINYIQNAVNASIGEDYEVKLYGSHATGLCLPWSDIDVVLCKKNGEVTENNYLPLNRLYTYLQKKNDFFKSINYIGTTSVPLIKIKTKENIGIQSVDISLQDKSHYGIKCVSLVLSFKEEYEVLLPMILALKNILKQANLNDPYKVRNNINSYNFINFLIQGGLSSYGLVLLVVHFLKLQKKQDKPLNIGNYNLGQLFYEFLVYYGFNFDPKENIIDPKGVYNSNESFAQHTNLIIIDPLNYNNNVARNTREFKLIKLAFSLGAIAAREQCECGCHYETDILNDCMKMEHCVLKRIFNAVKRHYSLEDSY